VALLFAVAAYLYRSGVLEVPAGLKSAHILVAAVFLFANAILAGWRLSVLARFEGYALALSPALKANAAGVALSQVMISFLGQAVGRAAILRRAGIPADVTITIGVFERLTAAAALSSIAVVSALYLFGRISFGQGAETEYLLWAGFGLLVSTLLAMVFVYRDLLTSLIHQLNLRKAGRDFLAIAGISLIVHGAMLGAYLALASAFTEEALPIDLLAACLVVMFTASLPISFGGWGVRELSAAAVLPFAGLTVTQGVVVALLVGVGALVVHLPIWFAVSGRDRNAPVSAQVPAERNGTAERTSQTYLSWLAVLVPVLASIAILFNLHLPTADGDLNINLADPLAIVGGMLAAAYWLERGVLPSWRVPALNRLTVLAMAVLCLAAIIGYLDFGFSTWAFRNRLGGWLLLLAYAGTGALMVVNLGDDGRRLVLKGLVVGLAAIAALGVGKLAYSLLGLTFFGEVKAVSLQGYSQNPNAFAFLLMAGLCAAIAFLRVKESRAMERILVLVAAVLGTAIVLTNSRAGWGTLALVCVTAMLIDRQLIKPIVKAVATGAALVLLILYVPAINFAASQADLATKTGRAISVFELGTTTDSDTISDTERWISVNGGLRLWQENPVFGAGLGAYFEVSKREGTPLVIHNTLIWLLAETGLVGFLVFFSAGVAILWASTRRLRDPTDVGATTIFLFLLAFASMSMVHELLYQRVLWFVLGVCLASVPILRSDTPLEKKP
jgi:O-antigen ligase